MIRITGLTSLVFASALAGAPAGEESAATPEDVRRRAVELTDRLGSPSYKVRTEAAGELLRMGRDALAALAAGKDDPNPEVRLHCERLYPIVERMELRARIDAFLDDPTGAHELPGLKRFLDAVGDDETARNLYAEMIKLDAPLIELADSESALLRRRYYQRVEEVQKRFASRVRVVNGRRTRESLAGPEMAALLFVGASPVLEDNDAAHRLLSGMFYQTEFQGTLQGKDGPPAALRKLFLHWLDRRARDVAAYQGFYLVLQIDLKEALPVARKIVADEHASTQARGMAAMAVGRFGSEDDLPLLEGLLDDGTVLTNVRINNVQGATQMRDVALAMCVHLTGQDHGDYPFDLLQGDLNFRQYYNLGFTSDEKRQEALKKWSASREKE